MIRAASRHAKVVLAAAADPLESPRQAFARDFNANVYRDFDDLCRDATLEAIYVASPHEFHAVQTIMALEHGKHVIVEKPLALSLADCDEIARVAKAAHRHVIVGHTHAFDPNVQLARKIAESGDLGRLGMILTFNYTDFLLRPRRPEELDTERGGGIAFNQLSHQIDMARVMAGSPVRSLRANTGILDAARPTEGHASVFVEFESGAAASIVYSGYDFFDSDEFHDWTAESGVSKRSDGHGLARRLLRTDGRSERERRTLMGYGSRDFPSACARQPHFGSFIATFERGDIRITPEGLDVFDEDGRRSIPIEPAGVMPGHANVLSALWKAMRHNEPCMHDAQWGRDTLEIILAVLHSARERREVSLDQGLRESVAA